MRVFKCVNNSLGMIYTARHGTYELRLYGRTVQVIKRVPGGFIGNVIIKCFSFDTDQKYTGNIYKKR